MIHNLRIGCIQTPPVATFDEAIDEALRDAAAAIADGGEDPGPVVATADIDGAASTRARIPSLQHDRRFGDPAPARHQGRAVA